MRGVTVGLLGLGHISLEIIKLAAEFRPLLLGLLLLAGAIG